MAIVTMTQALKKLYKAVVGEDTKKNNPTKIVSDLADNYSGGGSSLPEVSASDNGMLLTVVEGEWDKADAPSGSEPLIVTLQASGSDWIFDKTFTEVKEAFDEGRIVLILSPENRAANPFASIAVYYSATNTTCIVITSYGQNQLEYIANSADGYPKYHWSD